MNAPARVRPRLMLLGVVGALVLAGVGGGSASAALYATSTPMVLQEVPTADLQANKNGICQTGASHVIKNAAGTFNAVNYLNVAQACGLKVIFSFPETVNYATGVVYPSKVAAWVNKVKAHPATYGYLSIKEPNWSRINATEIRSMYKAFRAADPTRPVMALFGDIPHFGMSSNPYTTGMANIVMVNWYPVETTNGTNTIYLTGGPTHFARVKSYVAKVTPSAPVWLMVGTHRYLKPATHKKQRPNWTNLARQVREGFQYLGADGIAFHTWRNTNYALDQSRDPQMVSFITTLRSQVRAGTFK